MRYYKVLPIVIGSMTPEDIDFSVQIAISHYQQKSEVLEFKNWDDYVRHFGNHGKQ